MKTSAFIGSLIVSSGVFASGDGGLFDEVSELDSQLFTAFNRCDLETMGNLFSKDLEFFHDISGLTGYEETMQASRTNCERNLGLKRELVDGSMSVYPLGDIGAIQTGRHTFCHEVDGGSDCGTFGFTHVWMRDGQAWKLFRVVSYGH